MCTRDLELVPLSYDVTKETKVRRHESALKRYVGDLSYRSRVVLCRCSCQRGELKPTIRENVQLTTISFLSFFSSSSFFALDAQAPLFYTEYLVILQRTDRLIIRTDFPRSCFCQHWVIRYMDK